MHFLFFYDVSTRFFYKSTTCSSKIQLSPRYIPVSYAEEGLPVEWEKGDKTLIQVDYSSISPENGNTKVMTIYRYLVLLERQKKITQYTISYAEISRQASADTDGFSVKVSNGHTFKVLNNSSKPATCKTWFGDCLTEVAASSTVQKVFRLGYDRVNACSKIQKPYCILQHPLSLKVGRPVKAYFWSNKFDFKVSLISSS